MTRQFILEMIVNEMGGNGFFVNKNICSDNKPPLLLQSLFSDTSIIINAQLPALRLEDLGIFYNLLNMYQFNNNKQIIGIFFAKNIRNMGDNSRLSIDRYMERKENGPFCKIHLISGLDELDEVIKQIQYDKIVVL